MMHPSEMRFPRQDYKGITGYDMESEKWDIIGPLTAASAGLRVFYAGKVICDLRNLNLKPAVLLTLLGRARKLSIPGKIWGPKGPMNNIPGRTGWTKRRDL